MITRKELYSNIWNRIISTTKVDSGIISNYQKIFIIAFLIMFFPSTDSWISNVPDALYNPPKISIATFFTGFPDPWVIMTFNVLIVIGLVFIGLNRYTFIAGILTVVFLIIKFNLKFSLGKIDHNFLIIATLLCFTLGNWKAIKGKENGRLPIPPETLLGILIAFAMFTAGYQKAIEWIDFDMSRNGFLSWFNPGYYAGGRDLMLAPMVLDFPPIVIELFDYIAVFFELSAIVILFTGKRLLWKKWVLFALLFHIVVLLFLNIMFLTHLMVYLPFLLPAAVSKEMGKNTKNILNVIIVLLGLTQIYLMMENKTIINILIGTRQEGLNYVLVMLSITFLIGCYSLFLDFRLKRTVNAKS